MDGIFAWLGFGAAALFVVAVVVAWWEHLGRGTKPPDDFSSTPPRGMTVDVELDKLQALPPGDGGRRQQALGGAIARMAGPRRTWPETTPMVGPGPPVAPQARRDFVGSELP